MLSNKKETIFGCLLVATILSIFYSTYIFKTIAPNVEGWFETYANEIVNGKIPYKDFYLFTTPAFVYYLSIFIKVFGTKLYILHIAGALYHIACGIVVYILLNFLLKNSLYSVIVSVISLAVSSIDTGEPFTYYNHFAILWQLLSILLLTANDRKYSLLSGCSVFLCFLSKQSIGLIWIFTYFTALFLVIFVNKKYSRKFIYSVIGFVLCAIVYITYLYVTDSLKEFFEAIFFKGASSKGNPVDVLLRPIYPAVKLPEFLYPLITGLVINLFFICNRKFGKVSSKQKYYISLFNKYLFTIVLFLLFIFSIKNYYNYSITFRFISRTLMYSGVIYAIFIIMKSLSYYKEKNESLFLHKNFILLMFACSGLSLWYSLGMSFPIYEPVAVSTIPLLYINIYKNSVKENSSDSDYSKFNPFFVFSSCILVWIALLIKFIHPWDWTYWTEPSVFASNEKSSLDEKLVHFKLSSSTISTLDHVISNIKNNSKSQNDVFIYPYFPLFYVLCDKHPYTYSFVQFIDVCPDFVLQRDLNTLKSKLPEVLVTLDCPRDVVNELNNSFRSNGEKIQLKFYDYLEQIKSKYILVSKDYFNKDMYISVYVKK